MAARPSGYTLAGGQDRPAGGWGSTGILGTFRTPIIIVGLALLALAGVAVAASRNAPRVVAPDTAAFQRTWERTDAPVAAGAVARTWIWGPGANTPAVVEPYVDAPGGARFVQYFDKSRMELNNPAGDPTDPFYVTNGLLVVELMTGRLQLGDATFEQHNPALVNVAGDANDPDGPTYATFAALRDLPPLPDGAPITQRVARDGTITDDPSLAERGITVAYRLTVPGIDHQIAAPFWDFMNSAGPVAESGAVRVAPLFPTPFYATGYPLTEAYWATVRVDGEPRDVLVQCFERRCLTYTPSNPPGWQVEAGNVGLHYYHWRYVQIPAELPVTPTATPTLTPTPTRVSTITPTATRTPTNTPVALRTYTWLRAWGAPHDPGSALAAPRGIALGPNGDLYVADTGRNRIQRYSAAGVRIGEWGRLGSGEGQFDAPAAIAAGPAGDIYVADTGNNRVQVFSAEGIFLRAWGSAGAGPGQFNAPAGIAVDPVSGAVYVVDSGNQRVQKFTADGAYLTFWGGFGDGPGQFIAPSGVAVDAQGTVIVADTGNHRMQRFSPGGEFLSVFGGAGSGDGQFTAPTGVAVVGDDVFVADAGNGRVQAFTASGTFLRAWGGGTLVQPTGLAAGAGVLYVVDAGWTDDPNRPAGGVLAYTPDGALRYAWGDDRRGRFTFPAGIGLDPNGNPFVADVGTSRVQRFTPDGLPLDGWGRAGSGPSDLAGPWDVAVDAEGRIFVADGGNHRVQVFGPDGAFIGGWGSQGSGPGQFQTPTGIAVDDAGSVYVVDSGNARVLRFDRNGVFVESWGGPGSAAGMFTTPWGIAIRGQKAFVTDAATGRVQAFDLDGNFLWSFSPGVAPHGIALDAAGWIYVADTGNNRVRVFTPQGIYAATIGTAGSGAGQLSGPYDVAVDAAGTVYVTDTGNARVQVFAPATGD